MFVPDALKNETRWMVRRIVPGTDNKLPYSPLAKCPADYIPGSNEKSGSWRLRWHQRCIQATFEVAALYWRVHRKVCEGLSFVYHSGAETAKGKRFILADLDDAFDPVTGNPWPQVASILATLNTYTEYSRSRRGLHLLFIVDCEPFKNVTQSPLDGGGFIEIGCSGQVAYTGDVYGESKQVATVSYATLESLPFFLNRKTTSTASDINFQNEWWSKPFDGIPQDHHSLILEMQSWPVAIRDPNDPCDSHAIVLSAACKLARCGVISHEAVELLKQTPVDSAWTDSELRHKVESAYGIVQLVGEFNSLPIASDACDEFGPLPFVDDSEPIADEESETARPAPSPMAPEAFNHAIGRYILETDQYTRASRHARLIDMMIKMAAYIGRAAYSTFGARTIRAILFGVLVGKTGSGCKGETAAESDLVFEFLGLKVLRSFGSGEALIKALADPESDSTVDPITGEIPMQWIDKPTMLECEEYVNILIAASRESSTFSGNLRMAFDGKPMECRVKGETLIASNYHLCINGHITPEEIALRLSGTEKTNGYVNRIAWCHSQGDKKLNPFRMTVEERNRISQLKRDTAEKFAEELKTTRDWLLSLHPDGEIPAMMHGTEIGFTQCGQDAMADFTDYYEEFLETCPYENLIARGLVIVYRLALVIAVLHRSLVITAEHVQSAKAIWQYCQDSAAYIFNSQAQAIPQTALDSLHKWIKQQGTVTLRDVVRSGPRAFRTPEAATAALNALAAKSRGEWSDWIVNPKGGRPHKIFTPR
jgi:hypothetical protein